jgi:DnaJ-class molecular chaperone
MRHHPELRQAANENTATAGTDMNPGDEAPPGSPQTGENVCRECNGKGTTADGARCESCGGTGKVIAIVGDA